VDLLERFSNQSDPLKTLVRRVLRTKIGQKRLAERQKMTDLRGPIREGYENLQNILTRSEREALVADYVSGMAVNAIAEKYQVGRKTVWWFANKAGVVEHSPVFTDEQASRMAVMYLDGFTMYDIADVFATTKHHVRKALVARGVQIRPRNRQQPKG
jgi:predicted DNA-binding protein YlxM (UPF0122 family)